MNKIAVVVAHVLPASESAPEHIRYSVFERPDVVAGPNLNSNILLRYELTSIDQLLDRLSVEFAARPVGVSRASVVTDEKGTKVQRLQQHPPSKEVSVDLTAIALGTWKDYECYCVHIPKEHDAANAGAFYISSGDFYIRSVPLYGRASVIYSYEIARDCFTRTNIANVRHEVAPENSARDLVAMFDYMHEKIVPILMKDGDTHEKHRPS